MERADGSVLRYAIPMTSEQLLDLLSARGMKQAELARRLSLQLGRPFDRAAVNKMVKGTRQIADDEEGVILRILGEPERVQDMFTPQIIPGTELVGALDLPVYAAAQGGDGHLIVTFDPIDYVKRPEPLKSVKGGYGLLITGTSMVPAYRPGDIALMHPHLPPVRDTEVALYHTPPGGEAEAIIKTLVGFNDRTWTLQQYNPAREFEEFRKEWPICHRAVGKYNAR